MEDKYRVAIDAFEGPLDLLLHLVREHELDIHDIPIATITEQYLDFLGHLDRIDVEVAGEFLLMAATLIEIKSRVIAHAAPPDRPAPARDEEDPRASLIAQLIEYKKFRDAADALERKAAAWASRVPIARLRLAEVEPDQDEQIDLEDLHLSDLTDAFARIMASVNFDRLGDHEVHDEDTPIELHAEDLLDLLARATHNTTRTQPDHARPRPDAPSDRPAGLSLRQILAGRTRLQMIGMFIAVLELVRQRRVAVAQIDDEIRVSLREDEPTQETPRDEPVAEDAS